MRKLIQNYSLIDQRSYSIQILLVLFLSICRFYSVDAQDKLIKKDNSVVEGKVLKVDENNIEIDPTGDKPFLIIPRDEVSMIVYSDNTVINFQNQGSGDKVRTTEKAPRKAKITHNLTIDIYKPRSMYLKDNYIIDEIISLKDTLNNHDFDIYLKGGFAVTDSDPGYQIRGLNLKIDIRSEGTRNSEEIVFKRVYEIDSKNFPKEVDKVEGLDLHNNYVDLIILGYYLDDYEIKKSKNNIVAKLDFKITWSNF